MRGRRCLTRCRPLALGLLLALAACGGVESRIRRQQALFDGYPPAVQQNIRAGRIEPGYTPEMVRMALGRPDEVREGGDGAGETWIYRRSVPGFGFGIGSGGELGSHVEVGAGMQVEEPPRIEDEALVEFRGGRVVRFESLAEGYVD